MKVLTAIALLLALGAVALAKPTPVDQPAFVRSDADINIGTVGAMRERDYFDAPQSPNTCRLQPSLFNTTRLAQSCR